MSDTTSPPPLQIEGGPARDKTADEVPFLLPNDEYTYTAHRPKMQVLLDLAVAVSMNDELQQIAAFNVMLERILVPESLEVLRGRLRSNEDDLDLDSPEVINMFQTLLGLWYRRPTGKPAASRRPSSRTTKRSTGRSRAKA